MFCLTLSAKSKHSLEKLVESYTHFLSLSDDAFQNICYTTSLCRDHFKHRLILTAYTNGEAKEKLVTKEYQQTFISNETNTEPFMPRSETQLIELYLLGKPIDWNCWYKKISSSFSKVDVPFYCFDKKKYWVDGNSSSQFQKSKNTHQVQPKKELTKYLYHRHWNPYAFEPLETIAHHNLTIVSSNNHLAKTFLPDMNLSYVSDISALSNLSDHTLVYFFEKGDFEHLFSLTKSIFQQPPKRFIFITQQQCPLVN